LNATTRLYAPRPLNDQVPENIMTEVKPVVRQFIEGRPTLDPEIQEQQA